MSRRPVPEMVVGDSSSDDDDAPEELSVAASRQQGLSQIKDIQESLRRSKEEDRERRRQRNEKFRLQKKHKLEDLSKRRLPDDVLEAVSAKSAKTAQAEDGNDQSSLKKARNDDDDDSEEGSDHEYDSLSDSGVEDVSDAYNPAEDFIPFGESGRLVLVTPSALARKTQTAAQKALEFKQNRLYNQPTIPRETIKQRRARAAKRSAFKAK